MLIKKFEEVENETPGVSSLVEKVDYNAKVSEIEEKFPTTFGYNKFTTQRGSSNKWTRLLQLLKL